MKMLFVLFFPFFSSAAVDVAFLEIKNYKGEVIRLEPGGQFAHVAISYGNGWLHSHPIGGVQPISTEDLEKIGEIKSIIHLEEFPDITEKAKPYLGKPYEPEFIWNSNKFYCAKIVAFLLGIPPETMSFAAEIWGDRFKDRVGELGLSPDDIHRYLLANYKMHSSPNSCSQLFIH